MDAELESLILKYKQCLEQLSEINHKVEKVNSSEQVIVNHLSKIHKNESSTATAITADEVDPSQDPDDPNNKLNQVFNKLKLDVDAALSKRIAEVDTARSAAQLYIDKVLWNLFSRTELQNNKLLYNNDPHRRLDKNCLLKLIETLIEIDKQQEIIEDDNNEKEISEYYDQLHQWISHIITVYLKLGSMPEKIKILKRLTTTTNISTWAIPLIQFNDLSNIDDYIDIIKIVFGEGTMWIEDDYLAVLDQLAVDFTYNKLVIESSTMDAEDDSSSKLIFDQSKKVTDTIMKAVHQLSSKNNLVKRLSQTIIQMSIVLVDSMSTVKNCQEQLDAFICQLVYDFYDLKKSGWFFLPNIPFKALSIDALWDVTMHLLQLKNTSIAATKPVSLDQILGDHLPNIARFQYELAENQIQGFFMLSCLTNIATCIPPGVDEMTSVDETNNKNILSACIVTIISYTLFTIAFVDKNLREVFYKDVRDNFGPICKYHTFIISLLFRWTVQHISVMERMALYLFHSLDLKNWVILHDDLKLLHKLLSQQPPSTTANNTPQQSAQIQLAKYVINHLNFGYICCSVDPTTSKSQPWHSRRLPFLGYDIHEEIAFMLLDACQKFQPLPDAPPPHQNENKGAIELVGSVTSAVSTYLPIADQILLLKTNNTTTNVASEFINWAWSIALKLKLYDCAVSSRASDIEKSITLPFLRLVLNSYNDVSSSHSALLIYISFMLSATSRHFLRFESGDGWMKLLAILKRGKAEAIIQIFSEMVPSFVYMHGDDFFNDESLVDFFKHMIELKSDPMLAKAAAAIATKKKLSMVTTTGVGVIIGSHIWQAHLIDSVSNLLDESGQGFSYVDLVMHSWLKTVFRKSDWMWHSAYVNIVNTLCKLAFTLNRQRLVYHMLIEEQKRMEATKLQNSTSSPRITRFIKNMIPVSEGSFTTLLIGEWSVLKTNTFNKTPGIENQLYWFAFEALVMETVMEKDPYRDELVKVMTKQLSTTSDQQHQEKEQQQQQLALDINALYKLTSQKKPVEFFAIYRWLQHILVLPVDHVLLPLYLQMFFSLYYQCIDITHKVTLGLVFFNKRPELVSKLRDYIASAQTFYGQKMSNGFSTATTIVMPQRNNSGGTAINAEVLQQTYYAMWLWLGNVDLLTLETDIHHLPSHYDVDRLVLCHGKEEMDQPWYHVENYWMDLVDVDGLEQEFSQFSWEGSEKFRLEDDTATSSSISNNNNSLVEDSISLSTTSRRLRLITGESTIAPLPAAVINDPTLTEK
jgi:hypothetical protein